jgi:hypothetical protein
MGVSVFPVASAAGKTRFAVTLTSGTSYTVPAGVTYLNVTLQGGGAGSYASGSTNGSIPGTPGQAISSTLAATAGASITYAIGAGGAGGSGPTGASNGGTTTFTGATSAAGGTSGGTGAGANGTPQAGFDNGATVAPSSGKTGGAGKIEVEYWV